MDFYLSRAMQIAGMDIGPINDLHDRERERGYCLPNWNVQMLFHLPTIRERWCIPDDEAAQSAHANRVRGQLLSLKIARNEQKQVVNNEGNEITEVLKPWEAVTTGNIDFAHEYDARVYDAVQAGTISFAYEGAASSGTRLRDRVTSGRRKYDQGTD
jgi:hypothetical protein